MFAISSSLSTLPSLSARHTLIYLQAPSYRHSRLYHLSLAHGLLKASSCEEGKCRHGQHRHCNGLATLVVLIARAIHPMGSTLPVDPMT
jgi:hypothetical protein